MVPGVLPVQEFTFSEVKIAPVTRFVLATLPKEALTAPLPEIVIFALLRLPRVNWLILPVIDSVFPIVTLLLPNERNEPDDVTEPMEAMPLPPFCVICTLVAAVVLESVSVALPPVTVPVP